MEPEKVLVPVKVCVPLPLIIKFPLPDKIPSKELLIEELISKVAPDARLKSPGELLFLPQFPERITLPAWTSIPLTSSWWAFELVLENVVVPVPTLTTLLNVAAVPVIILSVDATPVSPVPSPKKLVALTTPTTFTFSLGDVELIPRLKEK